MRVKLTDQEGYTRRKEFNETKWNLGEWVESKGTGKKLCSVDLIHYYNDPLLAILFNPIHADIKEPKMWGVQILGEEITDGIKFGVKKLRITKEVELPVITVSQKVAFGVLCAKRVYKNLKWNEWANNWLSGIDRTEEAARAAAWAAAWAAEEAAEEAAWAAEEAARAAEEAARAAAWAAEEAARAATWAAAWAAEEAARVARAAEEAARAAEEAARAAEEAARASNCLNLKEIAQEALKYY